MRNLRNIRDLRNIRISTSMGIALTLLLAGLIVQATDSLELFGKNSFVPLIIGLIIIVLGVTLFLALRWFPRGGRSSKKEASLPANDD